MDLNNIYGDTRLVRSNAKKKLKHLKILLDRKV